MLVWVGETCARISTFFVLFIEWSKCSPRELAQPFVQVATFFSHKRAGRMSERERDAKQGDVGGGGGGGGGRVANVPATRTERMRRLELLGAVTDVATTMKGAAAATTMEGADTATVGVPAAALRGALVELLRTPTLSATTHAHVCVLAACFVAAAAAAAAGNAQRAAPASGAASLERLPGAVFREVAAYVDGRDLLGALVRVSRRLRAQVTAPGGLRSLALGNAAVARRATEFLPGATWAGLDALRLELGWLTPTGGLTAMQFLGPRHRLLALRGPTIDLALVPPAAWATIHTCSVDENVNSGDDDSGVVMRRAPHLEPGGLRRLRRLSLTVGFTKVYVLSPAVEVLAASVERTLRVLSLRCPHYTAALRTLVGRVAPSLEALRLEVALGETEADTHSRLWKLPPLPRAHTLVLTARRSLGHCFRLAATPHLALRHISVTGGNFQRLEVAAAPASAVAGGAVAVPTASTVAGEAVEPTSTVAREAVEPAEKAAACWAVGVLGRRRAARGLFISRAVAGAAPDTRARIWAAAPSHAPPSRVARRVSLGAGTRLPACRGPWLALPAWLRPKTRWSG